MMLVMLGVAAFTAPAFAQGNPSTTANPPGQPNVHGSATVQRGWNTNAFNGTGAAPPGRNGASGSAGGNWNTKAFGAHPATRAGGDAFGTTAFGDRSTNAFGRSDTARQNAERMTGAFPTQDSHGKWFETGRNPPETAPRQ